jgi:hypothetical protein
VGAVAANPKAGASCKASDHPIGLGAYSYTCKKSGKKWVWYKSLKKPTPTPNPTPTPTPTPSYSLTQSSELSPASVCQLQDQSGTIFNLGFPRRTVVKNRVNVRVMAIPFAFSDTGANVVGWTYSKQMLSEVRAYYEAQSYGKTTLDFSSPPLDPLTNEPTVITLNQTLGESNLPSPTDQVGVVHKILAQTPSNWDLSSYDTVLLYSNDWRTLNQFGGQAWQQPPGWSPQPSQVGPFTSPSGAIESLVFGSNHSDVISHELGHAIFGYIDLYRLPAFDNTIYTQHWDMMDAAYTGDYGLLMWEKWLSGWITGDQVRCISNPGSTLHFLTYNELPAPDPKIIVVKKTETSAVVLEARGVPQKCIYQNFCWGGTSQGILAYTLDVNKLSAQGAIVMNPENMAWPDVATAGATFTVNGTDVNVLQCTDTGCYVEIKS